MADTTQNTIQERPPIITIMGHIDHGKTSLLDYIRESRVTSREAGGITQHVGAYQVEANNQTLTFIDTPGHEAFQAIRTRGIKTSDILVIVVAADEGIKPQTEEAIQNAKATGLPIVVALTKIDKEETNVDKIKADLAERELTPEEWGGETVVTQLSSMTGEGVDTFLEMLTLVAEVSEITANYNHEYTDGFVLESFLDSKAGPLCDVIVQNGKLQVGDVLLVGTQTYGKVRRMNDEHGNTLKEAFPGQPVRILGLKQVAEAGEQFRVIESEKEAQKILEEHTEKPANEPVMQYFMQKEKNELNLILKADSGGSLEAIEYALNQIVQDDIDITVLN
ncbi:MAG: translation initiation factor IF-2, partial [Candidatus Paceibacteria bacterium]